MTNTIETTATKLILNFRWEIPKVKGTKILKAAAAAYWELYGDKGTEEAPIIFEDLNVNQKLNLIEKHMKLVVRNSGHSYQSNADQAAAREAVQVSDFEIE